LKVNWSSPALPVSWSAPSPAFSSRAATDDVAIVGYKIHEEFTVGGKPVVMDEADADLVVRL
jgi:hypothetical protein